MNKITSLIAKLYENTKNGTIKWEKRLYGDGIACVINEDVIALEEVGSHIVYIKIYNSRGDLYAEASSDKMSLEVSTKMYEMCRVAEAQALGGNDQRIDALISALG